MARDALPPAIAIGVHIREAHLEQDLALRVHRRCESSNVSRVTLHVRMQPRKIVMHGRMLGRLGQSRSAIRQRAVWIGVFKFLRENAA